MALTRGQKTSLSLNALALCCWAVTFLAGHDIWHGLGRPDIGAASGVSATDVRAFMVAYYLLPIPIVVQMAVAIMRGPASAGSRASATAGT